MTLPPGAIPLLIGTLLALTALSFVLYPLLQAAEEQEAAAEGRLRVPGRPAAEEATAEDQSTAEAALREIEFDRATGKLSDEDYAELKATYGERAEREAKRAAMAAGVVTGIASGATAAVTAGAAGASLDDAVEAAVRAAEARRPRCATCGPRPESDAVWCSECGGYLPGACASCGADVTAPGSRFCTACGTQLVAA